MRGMRLVILIVVGLVGGVSGVAQGKSQFHDRETLEYLASKAAKFSGRVLLPVDQLPPVFVLSREELNQEVCGSDAAQCSTLAAVFDDSAYRILIVNSLDLNQAQDNSYLLHEIVHSLQFQTDALNMYKDCEHLYRTEAEAYRSQDRYLESEGQFLRTLPQLRYFLCEGKSLEPRMI